jgi:hypothetical protein
MIPRTTIPRKRKQTILALIVTDPIIATVRFSQIFRLATQPAARHITASFLGGFAPI